MIRKYKPSVIWTTYPIASSHLIGYILHKLTKLPWVADFRDPMTEEDYPENPTVFKFFRWLENKVMQHAQYVVVTTPGVKRVYGERYGMECHEKIRIIQNGFDEKKFSSVEGLLKPEKIDVNEAAPIRLIHSGVIYPNERDPEPLFQAISELKAEGVLNANNFTLELRSAGHDELYAAMLDKHGIQDIVKLLPSISHEENIAYMLNADALLLLQGSTCNEQIPAKAYEYIRANKPIIALTDEKGDTGQLLMGLGVGTIAAMESKDQIKERLSRIEIICKEFLPLEREKMQSFSRQNETKQLADLLASI
jgi:glycosyltransferase involved in cell wall biosynthesis